MSSDLKMWEIHPTIWKTEAAYMSWLRGGIRRSLWNKSPVKMEFIRHNRIKIPNPNPRARVKEVWGGVCALTGEVHVLSDLEVDHKIGNHSLRNLDDLLPFIKAIVMVSFDDLQFVSKKAHKIKSYAERMGISFDEARVIKEIIELQKSGKDTEKLLQLGVTNDNIPSTKDKRRELLTKLMLNS